MIRGFEKVSIEQWMNDHQEKYSYHEWKDTYNDIKFPKRATKHSAGYDIYSPFDFKLNPNEEIKFPLGVKAYMLEDEFMAIYPRSGLGFKYYTRLANTIGIGDSDYYNNDENEGHYWIKLRNEGNVTMYVEKGEAVAQAIFQKYLMVDGDSFNGETREGGFGSTTGR